MTLVEVPSLDETERGAAGFGSTGVGINTEAKVDEQKADDTKTE